MNIAVSKKDFVRFAAVAMRCMEECDKRSKVHRRDVFGTARKQRVAK